MKTEAAVEIDCSKEFIYHEKHIVISSVTQQPLLPLLMLVLLLLHQQAINLKPSVALDFQTFK